MAYGMGSGSGGRGGFGGVMSERPRPRPDQLGPQQTNRGGGSMMGSLGGLVSGGGSPLGNWLQQFPGMAGGGGVQNWMQSMPQFGGGGFLSRLMGGGMQQPLQPPAPAVAPVPPVVV